MKPWFFTSLVALLVTAVCSQLETRGFPKPSDVINILNYVKRHAHEIDPHFGLGPLDLLKMAKLEMNITNEKFQVNGSLQAVVAITGISELTFDEPEINKILYYSLSLELPSVKLTGKYDIDGMIGNVFPLYGKGGFDITINNLNVTVNLKFEIERETQFLYIEEANFTLGVGVTKIYFENLVGGGEAGDNMNDHINDKFPTLLVKMKDDISELLKRAVATGFKALFCCETLLSFAKIVTETNWDI